jgi:hypothetical protein
MHLDTFDSDHLRPLATLAVHGVDHVCHAAGHVRRILAKLAGDLEGLPVNRGAAQALHGRVMPRDGLCGEHPLDLVNRLECSQPGACGDNALVQVSRAGDWDGCNRRVDQRLVEVRPLATATERLETIGRLGQVDPQLAGRLGSTMQSTRSLVFFGAVAGGDSAVGSGIAGGILGTLEQLSSRAPARAKVFRPPGAPAGAGRPAPDACLGRKVV